jgi:hypothetical protein
VDVVFLFLDESVDLDHAWLTGLLVPAAQYPDVRDAVIMIARAALMAAGHAPAPPTELHGVNMLRDVPGVTDEHRLQVFSSAVLLVNRERLEVVSVGHAEAKRVRQNLDQLHMDPGEKLHYLNHYELVETLQLADDVLVAPVFDGVPGRALTAKASASVDKFAHNAYLQGAAITQWNRIALEQNPVRSLRIKPNLRNLLEPTFSDSAGSPLLQLTDIIGYLLVARDRAERTTVSEWKTKLATIARGLDPELVLRRSVTINFQKP